MPDAQHLPGDVQLSRIADPGGSVVRALQWVGGKGFSRFEHARVYLGNGQFAEAMPGGAVIRNHLPLDGPDLEWDSGLYPLTAEQRAVTAAAAREYVAEGVGYSDLDYGSLVLKRLGVRPQFVVSYVASTGHMICSQFAARCRYDGGAPFWPGWTGDCTPGDIHDEIAARLAAQQRGTPPGPRRFG